MDQLIDQISQKTGISHDQAQQAANMVIDFVKQQLPPAISGQVDSLLKGGGAPDLGDIAGGLGGMFGGNK